MSAWTRLAVLAAGAAVGVGAGRAAGSDRGRRALAQAVERAVERVLERGTRTADIMQPGATKVSTRGMGDAILSAMAELAA